MNIKKIRHICGVRGCRNTDTFSVSRTRECGNSVIICADCAKEIYEAIKAYDPEKDRKIRSTEPPKLFYNDAADTKAKSVKKAGSPSADNKTKSAAETKAAAPNLENAKQKAERKKTGGASK